jgi:hypothetical protein
MCSCTERTRVFWRRGQATLEAAFLIPVVCLLLLMLCQPIIILYDRMVMESAAAEGCRLLATCTSSASGDYAADKYEGYVKRRLGSIPPVECFHIHEGECSYEIRMSGNERSSHVSVAITNRLRLLPIIGLGAELLGRCEPGRVYTQQVEVTMRSRPDWASGSPREWARRWT